MIQIGQSCAYFENFEAESGPPMIDGDGPDVRLPGATHVHEHHDECVGSRHGVQQRRRVSICGRFADGIRRDAGQLAQQYSTARYRRGLVERFKRFQDGMQVSQSLFHHLRFVS